MARWHTDREELVKQLNSASVWSITRNELGAQIRALDALYDLLEMGVISAEFYRVSLMSIAQIDTGKGVYFYTGLT
jgi:hypothetical protein